ncbi:MAG: hypothetical protein CL878_14520 [Dehalococcoidia bacterium]|nr:hypothetical protein [Dehalococcoidia bacterium]
MSAAALLPLVCLALLVLHFGRAAILSGRGSRWREAILVGAIVWGVLVAAFTEALSLFGLLTWLWLVGLWSLATVALTVLLLMRRLAPIRNPSPDLAGEGSQITSPVRQHGGDRDGVGAAGQDRMVVLSICGLGVIAVIAGLTAIVAPPNTYDSMTYHLPRVMHWIQNQSVAHYPTHIPRQLHLAPGAEFVLTHLHILAGNDRLANLVQWLSMVGSIIGVSALAQRLGASLSGQVFASVVAATLPMGMLQASSTQNDYVVTFWLICLAYFSLEAIRSPGWVLSAIVGASLGLALLTKVTAYLFSAPLLAWLLVSYGRSMRLCWRFWRHVALIVVVSLTVNLGHYARNTNLYSTPLGPGEEAGASYTNEVVTVAMLLSNIIRNASLHASLPIGSEQAGARISQQLEQWQQRAHTLMGMDESDPRTTWGQDRFRLEPFHMHEDIASNPLHLLLLLCALALICLRDDLRRSPVLIYAGALVVGFLLFCLTLKWQPWHSRLHLPLFVLWAPAVSIALSRLSLRWIGQGTATVLLFAALVLIGYNETRPLYGPRSILYTERADQYFATRPFGDDYRDAVRYLGEQQYQHIGLVLGTNAWEYPYWALQRGNADDAARLEHVLVSNVSSRLATQRAQPEAIVCVSCGAAQVESVMEGYREVRRFGIVSVINGRYFVEALMPSPPGRRNLDGQTQGAASIATA